MNHQSTGPDHAEEDPEQLDSAEDSTSSWQQRIATCLTIIAKNVPVTDHLLQLLGELQLHDSNVDKDIIGGDPTRSVALTRRQSEQQLFVSMATLEPDRLRQLANCLRIAGHPLMAELLLQTVTSHSSKDSAAVQSTEALLYGTSADSSLPALLADRLADSPEAQAELADVLSERRLLAWCRGLLFDPAGADVMSLRRQHAEESWRAAREVREKSAAMAQLQAKLSEAQTALAERDQTIAQLELRLSALAAAAGDPDVVSELRSQMEVSRRHQAASESQAQRATARLEAYCAAFDFVLSEIRQFESEATELLPSDSATATSSANAGFVESLRQELDDEHRLAAFRADFSDRFLTACRTMLDERRRLVRLAESLTVSANKTSDGAGGDADAMEFDPQRPLADELARLIARLSEENALLTARHRLLLKVLDDNSLQSSADTNEDELVAAVGSLRRQLAERDRRIASLTKSASSPPPSSPPLQPPRRSATITRAWDEVSSAGQLKRYSVLPDIQSQSTRRQSGGNAGSAGAAAGIPHSHRKATKREGNVKKREPPGKPLPANVVSLT